MNPFFNGFRNGVLYEKTKISTATVGWITALKLQNSGIYGKPYLIKTN